MIYTTLPMTLEDVRRNYKNVHNITTIATVSGRLLGAIEGMKYINNVPTLTWRGRDELLKRTKQRLEKKAHRFHDDMIVNVNHEWSYNTVSDGYGMNYTVATMITTGVAMQPGTKVNLHKYMNKRV